MMGNVGQALERDGTAFIILIVCLLVSDLLHGRPSNTCMNVMVSDMFVRVCCGISILLFSY